MRNELTQNGTGFLSRHSSFYYVLLDPRKRHRERWLLLLFGSTTPQLTFINDNIRFVFLDYSVYIVTVMVSTFRVNK